MTHGVAQSEQPKIGRALAELRWPNGEVPYVVPGVWAANDQLIASVEEAAARLNRALDGHVTIRPRRPGDRDYLVLHATTQVVCSSVGTVGRQGGAQNLHCELRSLIEDPTPVDGTLVRALCRALGVPSDFLLSGRGSLTPCVIDGLKQLYPSRVVTSQLATGRRLLVS